MVQGLCQIKRNYSYSKRVVKGWERMNYGYILLIILLVIATIVDIKEKIIPNWLVFVGFIIGSVNAFLNPAMSIASAAMAMVSAGVLLWTISYISKGGLGIGDVKLFACVGLFLGIDKIISAIIYATMISGLVGLLLLLINYSNRKKTMPFAPFILIGVLFTIGRCGL